MCPIQSEAIGTDMTVKSPYEPEGLTETIKGVKVMDAVQKSLFYFYVKNYIKEKTAGSINRLVRREGDIQPPHGINLDIESGTP